MLEKNYTNPEGIGRFSFSESGKFRAPYKSEGLYVFTVILISVLLEGFVIFFALNFLHVMLGDYKEQGAMFSAMASAVVIAVGSVIIFGAAGFMIAHIFSGINCKYSATEEKFVFTIGGDTHVIKYDEGQSITFTPRYFMGKVKGYDIDIVAANKPMQYSVTFRGQYQSEKTTPFYIIKERFEIIERRRSDEMALYAQQKIGADKEVTRNEIDRARLRKKHSDEIFPPNSKREEKSPKEQRSMDSVVPKRSAQKTETAAELPKNKSKMPELKAGRNVMNDERGKISAERSAAENTAAMTEIVPKNKRPSSEIFASDIFASETLASENLSNETFGEETETELSQSEEVVFDSTETDGRIDEPLLDNLPEEKEDDFLVTASDPNDFSDEVGEDFLVTASAPDDETDEYENGSDVLAEESVIEESEKTDQDNP